MYVLDISWVNVHHLNRPKTDTPGLTLLPELKFEHINLTSYSKMRVDLAAQVRDILVLQQGIINVTGP